nr:hypothetical protein [uncultured Desulfobulbus sp.]
MKDLDQLTIKHTAFPRFSDLLNAGGGYRPSLGTSSSTEKSVLADAYDKAQGLRGDRRKAFRF